MLNLTKVKVFFLVLVYVFTFKLAKRESDLLMASVITYRIGRRDVLLRINQNYHKIPETNKPSIERCTILKRRYEC